MDIYLDPPNARKILAAATDAAPAARSFSVSLDLNLTSSIVRVDREAGKLGWAEGETPLEPLEDIVKSPRKVFRLDESGAWRALESFDGGYQHLVPTEEAPMLEIDGVQMHRTQSVHPFEGAAQWAREVVKAGDHVLDTCGGLGYSAIQAVRQGASRVDSAELRDAVRELRALNPWSRLERGLPIELNAGDVFALVGRKGAASYDSAIHDPPRYSLAPDLYSSAFYVRLHEVLRPGGRLFHYTGSPFSRGRGRDVLGGIAERLQGAGFRVTRRPELEGFVCLRR